MNIMIKGMQLSENPLSKGQNKLLGSRKSLGRESPQVKKDITNHLDKSVRYLHNILKDTHNLKKVEVYDRINAQTIIDFLVNSMKKEYSLVYDFRTVELARTLFEISKQYLEQNPILRVHDQLQEDTKRSLQNISESYYILAKSALDKAGHDVLTIKDEKRIKDNLDRIRKSKEEIQTSQKYTKLENDKRTLQDKAGKLDQEWTQKSNSIPDLIKDGNTKAIKIIEVLMIQLKDKEKQINQKVVKIQNEQKKFLQSISEETEEVLKELSKKYDHLKPYFSLINRLDEFSYTYSPHKPTKEQAQGL